ncbi:MAG: homoserine dehydrogenase [Thermovirga sp.]
MRVLFIGFGNVGRTIARILTVERPRFLGMYPLDDLVPIGIVTRRGGSLVDPEGVDLRLALEEMESEGRFPKELPGYVEIAGEDAARNLDYDVIVELSTLSVEKHGEPAATHIRTALSRGRHAVSANKGPIAFSYRELSGLAKLVGKKFLFETTVMDGAPVFNLRESCLKGCVVTAVDGILNSTTNYILSRMEEGVDFSKAVKEAQDMGVAEADPRNDIDGWDASAKVSALANVLLDADMTPLDVDRHGIAGVTSAEVMKAVESGKKLKLVCKAWKEYGKVYGKVGVEEVPVSHHFSLVSGGGAVLRIHTDLMGPILVTQENPDLYDTAYGVLGDLITLRQLCQ